MKRGIVIGYALGLILTGAAMVWAQGGGCGQGNPNCVVPTPPLSDSSNRAANTSWVNQFLGSGNIPTITASTIVDQGLSVAGSVCNTSTGIFFTNTSGACPGVSATGSGIDVLQTAPTLISPILGIAQASSIIVGASASAMAETGNIVEVGIGAAGIFNLTRLSPLGQGGAAFSGQGTSSTVYGQHGAVSPGNVLMSVTGTGDDGTTFNINAARLQAIVDGAVSSGIIPGRWDFSTSNYAGTITPGLRVDHLQHVGYSSASSPTISGCGTPTVTGNDSTGRFTAGTGGANNSCTVTFASAFTIAPNCSVSTDRPVSSISVNETTTNFVIQAGPTATGVVFKYNCRYSF